MTECNKCGDCCETIYFPSMDRVAEIVKWVSHPEAKGWTEEYDNNVVDALFTTENWKLNDDEQTYHCLKFDKENRICSVHEDRPYVCRGFPWYGKKPWKEAIAKYPSCSFWEDLGGREQAVSITTNRL